MKIYQPIRYFAVSCILALATVNCVSKYDIVRKKNDSFAQSQLLSLATLLKNPAEPSRALFGSNPRTLEIQFVKEIKNNAEVKNELTFSFNHVADDADMASKAFFSVDGKPFEVVLSGVGSSVQSTTSSNKSTSYQHSATGPMKAVETTTVSTHTFKVSKGQLNLPQPLAAALTAGNAIQVRVYFGGDTATFSFEENELAALKRYLRNTPDEEE
ncbi:MAG: hypothetical protein U1F27_14300 [Turneriella sp.]